MQFSSQENSEDAVNYFHRFVLGLQYRINWKLNSPPEVSEPVPKPKYFPRQGKLKKKQAEWRAWQPRKSCQCHGDSVPCFPCIIHTAGWQKNRWKKNTEVRRHKCQRRRSTTGHRMVEENDASKAAGLRGQLSRRWAAYHKWWNSWDFRCYSATQQQTLSAQPTVKQSNSGHQTSVFNQ